MTPDIAVSLVTERLVPAEGNTTAPVAAATATPAKDGFGMPLFGTLVGGSEALEVCDGCEQFILTDEQRITTPAVEIIEGRDGRITDSSAPGRVFHTHCYGPWQERVSKRAGVEPIEAPVNAPAPTPEPAADVTDPASFGAVSMDSWMSAFGLEVEDIERGKRKRTRKSRKAAAAQQATLLSMD